MSINEFVAFFVSSFMALFPMISPISSGLTVNMFLVQLTSEQRKSAIRKIMLNYFLISFGTLLLGHFILVLFGLSVPYIQIGGGVLICKTGLEWLSDTNSDVEAKENEASEDVTSMKDFQKKLFYPITFPIIFGAGCMSVIFTLMAHASEKDNLVTTLSRFGVIGLVLILMAIMMYPFLSQGERIMKKLGDVGNLVMNKLIAFFTFCIGIQVLLTGLAQVFHLKILS